MNEKEAVTAILGLQAEKKTLNSPMNVQIEMSAVCPQKCIFCPLTGSMERLERSEGLMDDTFFRSLIDQLAVQPPLQLMLHASGESTVHPHFGELGRYAREKLPMTFLRVNTGGLLWTTDEKRRDWLSPAFDKITFSIEANRWLHDGLDAEGKPWATATKRGDVNAEYKRFVIHPHRAGAPWGIVIPNLIRTAQILAEMRAADSRSEGVTRTHLYAQHVVSREQETLDVTDRFGARRTTWEIEFSRAFWAQYGVIVQYVPIATVGGNVDTADMRNADFARRPMGECKEVFQNFTVAWDGRVAPCCQDSHALQLLPEINLMTMTLRDAWRHVSLERLREQHRAGGGFPSKCHACLRAL